MVRARPHPQRAHEAVKCTQPCSSACARAKAEAGHAPAPWVVDLLSLVRIRLYRSKVDLASPFEGATGRHDMHMDLN